MLYGSTRIGVFNVKAPQAILQGIAPDGGLYVPQSIPDLYGVIGEDFISAARQIISAFFPELAPIAEEITRTAYERQFSHPAVTPLVRVGSTYVLELFHGPTAAFKDVALCALPHLLTATREYTTDDREILILTATSGDTGSAALAGFSNVPSTRVLVFYPQDGVSPVQKAQMVTMAGGNLKVCGIQGNFDDAQTGVKQIFAGFKPPKGLMLSSANSINMGRLVPQITYYFTAYASLLREKAIALGDMVNFVVPTGNFGDILAGYLAKQAGLPIDKLVCATNSNDVLNDFIQTGVYDRRRNLHKTLSPSMDILVSSNLERLLYFVSNDAALVTQCMDRLQNNGYYHMPIEYMQQIRESFMSAACRDEDALHVINRTWNKHHYLMDPHTASAWKVMEDLIQEDQLNGINVVLSTASPFKFPGAIAKALKINIPIDVSSVEILSQMLGLDLPTCLKGLSDKPVLHRDVIDPTDMLNYVTDKAVEPW
ncbi:MAG TPA: threonine synthase [Christensenellaceae bacterium]|nr:threonine synthase [Christensenellaceae bacterium]